MQILVTIETQAYDRCKTHLNCTEIDLSLLILLLNKNISTPRTTPAASNMLPSSTCRTSAWCWWCCRFLWDQNGFTPWVCFMYSPIISEKKRRGDWITPKLAASHKQMTAMVVHRFHDDQLSGSAGRLLERDSPWSGHCGRRVWQCLRHVHFQQKSLWDSPACFQIRSPPSEDYDLRR